MTLINQTFAVGGMTCSHCEKAVIHAVKHVDPQARVKIDRSADRVEVQSTQARAVLSWAISAEGYVVAALPPEF